MNHVVVQNAVGQLKRKLGPAQSALRQIEAQVFRRTLRDDEGGYYDNPREALAAILQELHDILLVVLEAAEMPETRRSLVTAWSEFIKTGGLQKTNDNEEYENSDSPAYNFIESIVDGLQISLTQEISSEGAWTLNRLEEMLRDTAAIVRRRNIKPENEGDLQQVMHDYLRVCFPDFTLNPNISGTLKKFKPDCGIRSVSAAVEFKIVHREEQVAVAFSGIAEDSAGYKGSKDWTRFYAVFYQAEPFMFGSHLRHDMGRIGATTWTPILVNGPTKKKAKKKVLTPP